MKQAPSAKNKRTETQILLAQYFTPASIADYMSQMFVEEPYEKTATILDAGAGEGILGLSLINKLNSMGISQSATFVEFDEATFKSLQHAVDSSQLKNATLLNDDFITASLKMESDGVRFSHIILNPPYFKLRVDSISSKTLRQNAIHVTNIYAAFVWLSARLLVDNGQLVAIIPRSFCNGPYFLKFRQFLTSGYSIDAIHTFLARNKAFAHDSVLQENIILRISKRKQSETVRLTYSTDQSFTDIAERTVPFDAVITQGDMSKTIHIPAYQQVISLGECLPTRLHDLNIGASTGPIVDFRLKENILKDPTATSIPLLYPSHMSGGDVMWPQVTFNKQGQHYEPLSSTDKAILPLDGYYVIVRRFSSKEEKRRIFAAVVAPEVFSKATNITFENHLNYFHAKKHGFEKDLAYGLSAFLNSFILDEHFRKVSGHTQVNVSDLKNLPYPNYEQLIKLGVAAQKKDPKLDDIIMEEIVGGKR